MTSGEMKFALRVESALNTIPEPEFRQLFVEAIKVLSLVSTNILTSSFGETVIVDDIVKKANQLFLQDHVSLEIVSVLDFAGLT